MVLGHGFKSWNHLKLDGKDVPFDCRKNNKGSQMEQVTTKKYFLKAVQKSMDIQSLSRLWKSLTWLNLVLVG